MLVLIPLVDHLAELPVVKLVVSAGVELGEGYLDLLVAQVFANWQKFLTQTQIMTLISFLIGFWFKWNELFLRKYLLGNESITIFVHIFEQFLYWWFLTHELFEAQSTVKISIHPREEILDLLPEPETEWASLTQNTMNINKNAYYIEVGTPELLRTCLHSSGVSFPSLFLSALLNILRTCENNK